MFFDKIATPLCHSIIFIRIPRTMNIQQRAHAFTSKSHLSHFFYHFTPFIVSLTSTEHLTTLISSPHLTSLISSPTHDIIEPNMSGMSFVDLTASSPAGQQQNLDSYSLYNMQNSPSLSMPPERKRRRLNVAPGLSAPPSSPVDNFLNSADDIETVDMTTSGTPPTVSKARAKQQEDAVKSQQPEMEPSRSALMAYKCPVCMDTPEDATTTTCGMLILLILTYLLCARANTQLSLRRPPFLSQMHH